MLRERRLHRTEAAGALRALGALEINYPSMACAAATWGEGWRVDVVHHALAQEPPGAPVVGGAWDIACRLVRDYQFAEPAILRALYRRADQLLGREMLLEGRFSGLRFDMGVRVTSVTDETRGTGDAARRVWGWGYQTLQGHLEEGELSYQVTKHLSTGDVEFLITGYSRRAPIPNPFVRVGFRLFGRATQHRFYRASARRLRRLVQAELHGAPALIAQSVPGDDSLVIAPSTRRGSRPGRRATAAR